MKRFAIKIINRNKAHENPDSCRSNHRRRCHPVCRASCRLGTRFERIYCKSPSVWIAVFGEYDGRHRLQYQFQCSAANGQQRLQKWRRDVRKSDRFAGKRTSNRHYGNQWAVHQHPVHRHVDHQHDAHGIGDCQRSIRHLYRDLHGRKHESCTHQFRRIGYTKRRPPDW